MPEPTISDLDREHARVVAQAARTLAAMQEQAGAVEAELRARLAAAEARLDAIHRAGHIPAASGHPISRLLLRAGRRARTAGL